MCLSIHVCGGAFFSAAFCALCWCSPKAFSKSSKWSGSDGLSKHSLEQGGDRMQEITKVRKVEKIWLKVLVCVSTLLLFCRWTSHRAFDVGKEAQIPGHQSWSFGPHSQDPSWRSWAVKGLFQCCWTLCHLLRPRFQTKPTSVCDPGNNWACLERFAQRLLCCFPATKPVCFCLRSCWLWTSPCSSFL